MRTGQLSSTTILRELRMITRRPAESLTSDEAQRMAELFTALDGRLSSSGELPIEWIRATAQVVKARPVVTSRDNRNS